METTIPIKTPANQMSKYSWQLKSRRLHEMSIGFIRKTFVFPYLSLLWRSVIIITHTNILSIFLFRKCASFEFYHLLSSFTFHLRSTFPPTSLPVNYDSTPPIAQETFTTEQGKCKCCWIKL